MNYRKVLDDLVAFIGGVYGGGISYTLQIAWRDEGFKLLVAGITALVCGAMGVAGKYLFVWAWKQAKVQFNNKKNVMKDFFKEARERLKSPTPDFFKKIGALGVSFAASGTAIVAPEVVGAHMPDMLVKVGAHMLSIGAVMKAVSHFACTDPPAPKS
jgi:hypothetical protein